MGAGATLADVARRAGVSASTVSRALNGTATISQLTIERVGLAAEELGYVPHRAARHLAGGRTGAVAVVVPDLTNPFFSSIARGAQRRAQLADEMTYLADAQDLAADEVDLITRIAPDVDGLVLCSPVAASSALATALGGRPAVLVNRRARGWASVVADQAGSVRLARDHLSSCGHSRIAYVRGPADKWVSTARDRVARDLGLEMVGPVPPTFAGGVRAAALLVRGISAVIAHNDLVAIGLVEAVQGSGRRVPEDLSVVGCDDVELASLVRPKLTSVRMPFDDLGCMAMESLLDRIGGSTGHEALVTRVLPVTLSVRDSTGPPAAKGRGSGRGKSR